MEKDRVRFLANSANWTRFLWEYVGHEKAAYAKLRVGGLEPWGGGIIGFLHE